MFYFLDITVFSSWSFSVVHSFHLAPFFVLQCFHVVPFVHSFHIAPFLVLYPFHLAPFLVLGSFHVAPFFFCISSSVSLFSCCIFFSLELLLWPVFCFTLFNMSFFAAAFSLTAHFSNYSFQVAPFFSSTFLMLYSFHNALSHGHLPWCAYIMLRSFKAAIFHIATCSYCPISFLCIFFMLHISRRYFFLLYFLIASTIQFCFGYKLNKQVIGE